VTDSDIGFMNQVRVASLRAMRNQLGQDALVPMGRLYGDDVELQKVDLVGGVVIAHGDVRPELVGPEQVAHRA
jgi:hypothetical protein